MCKGRISFGYVVSLFLFIYPILLWKVFYLSLRVDVFLSQFLVLFLRPSLFFSSQMYERRPW